MTKTEESAKTPAPGPRRGLAWAWRHSSSSSTMGGLYFAFNGDDGQVVDQTTMPTPTPTTVLEPEPATTNVPEAVKLTGALPVDLEPGTYWIDHDADSATSLRVEFTLAEPGWGPFVGVNKSGPTDASGYVAASSSPLKRWHRLHATGPSGSRPATRPKTLLSDCPKSKTSSQRTTRSRQRIRI